MDTNKLQPVEAQYFTGPVANEDANSYRTVPSLLRDVALWMEENDIADTEFQNIVVEIHFEKGPGTALPNINRDSHHFSATVYHLKK